jgi:hypothetical protein
MAGVHKRPMRFRHHRPNAGRCVISQIVCGEFEPDGASARLPNGKLDICYPGAIDAWRKRVRRPEGALIGTIPDEGNPNVAWPLNCAAAFPRSATWNANAWGCRLMIR